MEDINIINLINNCINGSNTTSVDWGNSSITLFGGNDNYRNTSIQMGNGGSYSRLNLSNNNTYLGNTATVTELVNEEEVVSEFSGGAIINDGKISIVQSKAGKGSTYLTFDTPITNTYIKVPAKEYGTYTVALLEDLLNIGQHLQSYIDNTAALAAGLVIDQPYKTPTGEIKVVV